MTCWSVSLSSKLQYVYNCIDGQYSIESLSPEEWSTAAEIKNILLPMKQLTNMMSGDQYTTASSAIVYVDGLLNTYTAMVEIKKYVETNNQVLMRNIIEDINIHLGSLEKSNTLLIATFLDPRYKNVAFTNDGSGEQAKKLITNMVAQQIKIEANAKLYNQPPPPDNIQTPEGSEECPFPSFLSSFREKAAKHNPV